MYPIAPFSFGLLMNFILSFLMNSDGAGKVSVSLVQGLVCTSFKSCVLSGSPQSSAKIDNCGRLCSALPNLLRRVKFPAL